MQRCHPILPRLWLISDARNDKMLEAALNRLPRGSGFVYRHYHLPGPLRHERFASLKRIARSRDQKIILADSALTAREWGADGIYGPPRALQPRRSGLLHLATVHCASEIALANRIGVDAVLLSTAFPTRSHPGDATLGAVRFRLLAKLARVPVIALGGMTHANARRLVWQRWAAIDGLS